MSETKTKKPKPKKPVSEVVVKPNLDYLEAGVNPNDFVLSSLVKDVDLRQLLEEKILLRHKLHEEYQVIEKRIKGVEKDGVIIKEGLNHEIDQLCTLLGVPKLRVVDSDGSYVQSSKYASCNTYISGSMLQAAGVRADIIANCTQKTPYTVIKTERIKGE